MKIKNPFFKKKENIYLSDIFKSLKINKNVKKIKINDIKDLKESGSADISFFNSSKYFQILKKTKAKYIITEKKYENLISTYSEPIIVTNVLKSVSKITKLFYPDSLNDCVDFSLDTPNKKKI